MTDPIRRRLLKTGAAATVTAAAPAVFAQQTVQGGAAMSFYEKGAVRIHYEEAGSGFPMLIIPGGGLNSTPAFFTSSSPFNPMEEFKVWIHEVGTCSGGAAAVAKRLLPRSERGLFIAITDEVVRGLPSTPREWAM